MQHKCNGLEKANAFIIKIGIKWNICGYGEKNCSSFENIKFCPYCGCDLSVTKESEE